MSNNIDLVGRLSERIDLNTGVRPSVALTDPPPAPAQPGESLMLERAGVQASSILSETATRTQEASAPASEALPFELNLRELSMRGFLTAQNSKSLAAEEYRLIKRPLLRSAFNGARKRGDRSHVAMVTSARPDDGKTFTALNLALSIASERDIHVLLVDADVRHRGLSKTLAMADKPGLMDLLSDDTLSLDKVIQTTNIPRLAVIPAGQRTDHPTETLASRRTAAVMREMTERFADRFIIFDTPPVLAANDAAVLAGYVGQAIMVVLANETSKRAVIEALAMLEACPSVSFVLNKMALTPGFERFGYYGDYT
jgi:exopolysaccharide/PEP-CTERM locus tyrosine autokinase